MLRVNSVMRNLALPRRRNGCFPAALASGPCFYSEGSSAAAVMRKMASDGEEADAPRASPQLWLQGGALLAAGYVSLAGSV